MAKLTGDFKDTVRARMKKNPKFRQRLLRDAVNCLLDGDTETGYCILRDFFLDDVSIEDLAREIKIPTKRLASVYSPVKRSPTTNTFFNVISYLSEREGINLKVVAK